MRLLAAARATVAASQDGEHDPMSYLVAELSRIGQVPEPGLHPQQILADCAAAFRALPA